MAYGGEAETKLYILISACRQAKRLKEAIAKSQHGVDGIGELHSEAGSDGAWEMLHQEVFPGQLET